MSGPVDVLAVLDEAATWVGPDVMELRKARAAFAELIEAAKRVERKAIEQSRSTSSVFTADITSLRAALARAQGGA